MCMRTAGCGFPAEVKQILLYEFNAFDQKSYNSYNNSVLSINKLGAVARSDARPPDMRTVAGSILTSGKTLFR